MIIHYVIKFTCDNARIDVKTIPIDYDDDDIVNEYLSISYYKNELPILTYPNCHRSANFADNCDPLPINYVDTVINNGTLISNELYAFN